MKNLGNKNKKNCKKLLKNDFIDPKEPFSNE